ncbi:MAG: histidine phosphatase family protein [Anaerolineae bacterium]|nr:histidine phosphatase family protein [Anaerolineae bacterium]
MQFYFIRHGQSSNNALHAQLGSHLGRNEDPELTAVGLQQAECLAQFLARPFTLPASDAQDRQNASGFSLTHLYTSLMARAVHTATIVGKHIGLNPVAWADAHEEWGIYLQDETTGERVGLPGKNRHYLEQHYPSLVLPDWLDEDGWWNRPAEPIQDRIPRARRFLADLLARHGDTDDRVGVISHGGFYQCVMAVLFDITLIEGRVPDGLRFSLNNCAITRIDLTDRTRLIYANRAEFIPAALLT